LVMLKIYQEMDRVPTDWLAGVVALPDLKPANSSARWPGIPI
jgi:hypothetical protein